MDCIFCKIANKEIKSRIVYEDDQVISIMDVNPKAMGHLLIIPKNHYQDYTEAADIINHIFEVAKKIGENIMKTIDQKGYSLIINYGDAQEVKHLHLHLIPNNSNNDYDIEEIYKKIKM